jgi:elongation factor 1-alpha
VIAAALGIK